MPRYFMHLRDYTEELLDPEGQEFPDTAAVRDAVLVAARGLLMEDVRDGLIDLRFRIDATDDRGAIVHMLPFAQALNIIPAVPAG